MTANLLARIPFFADFPVEELDHLLTSLDKVNLASGDILFQEGDPAEHLYVVINGELEIIVAPGTAEELILTTLKEGEYLGEMGLIVPGSQRTTTARARGDVDLLSMSRSQFRELLQRYPMLANVMVSVLSQRLDNTNVARYRDLIVKNRPPGDPTTDAPPPPKKKKHK